MAITTAVEVEMCEGVEGVWSYHLRSPGSTKALCGHSVMDTGCTKWGYRSHLNERYCAKCEKKARLRGKPPSP